MRVTDRDPLPLWDCDVDIGEHIFEQSTIYTHHCVHKNSRIPLTISEVLLASIGTVDDSSCVYLATDKSDHEKTLAFKKIVSAHMRVIEYKDLRLDNCEHMIPSILEQAIAARISGHYIGTFPSSWDEMVYHERDRPEELDLWLQKVRKLMLVGGLHGIVPRPCSLRTPAEKGAAEKAALVAAEKAAAEKAAAKHNAANMA
tara:strand:- start:277 stop:879 length:603 start_codon:yes stop_codon:yes gene_type:complete